MSDIESFRFRLKQEIKRCQELNEKIKEMREILEIRREISLENSVIEVPQDNTQSSET